MTGISMKSLLSAALLSVFILASLLSCRKDSTPYALPPDLLISTGYECGWCSFNDSLVISLQGLTYSASGGGCDNYHNDTLIYDFITKEELTSLMMKLDLKKYFACTLDQCGICGDGCDHWIDLTANGQLHHIRYTDFSYDDSLQWLSPFVNQLNDIRKRYLP